MKIKKAKILSQIQKLISGKTPNAIVRNVCGELIGEGLYRDVYAMKKFPDYVVKIERTPNGRFANATEWRHYVDNEQWDFLNAWLAECLLINETGQVMVQERVYWDGKKRKDYPKYIPVMFTDLKLKNFGWTKDGRFVCCDYSFIPFYIIKVGKNSMKYAKWWGSLKQPK